MKKKKKNFNYSSEMWINRVYGGLIDVCRPMSLCLLVTGALEAEGWRYQAKSEIPIIVICLFVPWLIPKLFELTEIQAEKSSYPK